MRPYNYVSYEMGGGSGSGAAAQYRYQYHTPSFTPGDFVDPHIAQSATGPEKSEHHILAPPPAGDKIGDHGPPSPPVHGLVEHADPGFVHDREVSFSLPLNIISFPFP